MQKKAIAKKIARLATGYAIGTAAYNIIRSHTPQSENPVINFTIAASVYVAAYGVTGVVADAAADYTDQQIDEIVEQFASLKK